MIGIYVLWLKQMRRFRRSPTRIITFIIQPLLYFLAFGYGFGPVFQRAGEGNYIQFLAPAVAAMTLMFNGFFSGIDMLFDRRFGFFKVTLVAPVPRAALLIGRVAGAATLTLTSGVLVLLVCYSAGFRVQGPAALISGLLVMVLIALLFAFFGAVLGSILDDFQTFQLLFTYVVMPMFFLSGALFPLNRVPPALRAIAKLDPFAYAVDGLRAAFLGGGAKFQHDIAVLAWLTVFFVLWGVRRMRRIEA